MTSATATRPVTITYAARSELVAAPDAARVVLALDGVRGAVGVRGRVRAPAVFRDALMTAAQILRSDLRYRGTDRTAYLAYLAKKGKKATAAVWEAQKAFLDNAFGDEQKPATLLDPVLTVHPDEVSLEVFSRDESAYARLALPSELFDGRQAAHGTTFADLSDGLLEGLDRMRTHTPMAFEAGVTGTPGTGTPSAVQTRSLEVPYAWLRGFLQVQSAATLPATHCELAPIDLYNLLYALRIRRPKKSPRALRFELVPGARPRLVLEPWEIVLETHGAAYGGAG